MRYDTKSARSNGTDAFVTPTDKRMAGGNGKSHTARP